jgi:hypothetical protein
MKYLFSIFQNNKEEKKKKRIKLKNISFLFETQYHYCFNLVLIDHYTEGVSSTRQC